MITIFPVFADTYLSELGLNEWQLKAVKYVKKKGKITNKEYQKVSGIKKRQTTDDLRKLEDKGILKRIGVTGKGTYYI